MPFRHEFEETLSKDLKVTFPPLQCDFCPLAPKHITQISYHLKRYHKKTDLKRFEGYVANESKLECRVCSVSVLRNLNSIKIHMNRYVQSILSKRTVGHCCQSSHDDI